VELIGPVGAVSGHDLLDDLPHPVEEVRCDRAAPVGHDGELGPEGAHRPQLLRGEGIRGDQLERVALDGADEGE
jgi:hypothetical protein